MTHAATTPTHIYIQVSARYATFARRSKWSMDSLLFSFVCQCRGVKFYDLRNAGRRWGTKLSLVREPTNLRDPLCVTGLDVTIFLPTSRVHTYLYCVYGRSLYSRNNAIRAL